MRTVRETNKPIAKVAVGIPSKRAVGQLGSGSGAFGVASASSGIPSWSASSSAVMVERYLAVVPDEGKEATTTILDVLRSSDGNFSAVLADADAGAAMEELTALESEVCGIEGGSDQDPSVQEIDEAATRVDLTLADYEFVGDLPTAAGRYSFVFTNEGDEPHIAILVRLEEGTTLADAMASEGEEGVAESFESSVAAPGTEAVITADLGPGEWTLLCPIPDAEGASHIEHGMVTTFTVT